MIAFPNAKINLGLNIIEKRRDGYHNIETVFYPLQLCDVLEIVKKPDLISKTEFNASGLAIPGRKEHNLCLKAYHLLKTDFDLPPVHIHLHKVIPMGAGLGGGSSDAAFTLKILNSLFELDLNNHQLHDYASLLGADCAFFIENKPLAASEKGDLFSKIRINLTGKTCVVVVPDIHLETAKAYAGARVHKPEKLPSEIIENYAVTDWKSVLKNDFEKSLFRAHPVLAEIKSELYRLGAVYASMSGSGSAIFGLFDKPVDLSANFNKYFYRAEKI